MPARELTLLAVVGFLIWLSGAVTFRFGGALMFENGPAWLLGSAAVIALSVCLLLVSAMNWRKLPPSQSVPAAVVMILPGLFGDVAYIAKFTEITGLKPSTAAPYAAVMIFGTAVLLAFAMWRSGRVQAEPLVH
jgi:hypothetical protein